MKKIKWILPLCVLALMLAGCPYGSDVPISKPDIKVHHDLLGKWEPKGNGDEVYQVIKADEHIYRVEKTGGASKEKTVYTAWFSDVDGATYMNLQGDTNNDKKFYLYKVDVNSSNSKIVLKEVTENIVETFTSSDELKKFIKKYQSLSFFFGKDSTILFKD